jgi:hypothetical protein
MLSLLAFLIRVRFFWWLKKILTILVLATAVFAAYEYIAVRVKGYPHNMHLMDRQYRIIPIHLEGRTATHLHITRRDSQRFFSYEIEGLHPINQWRIRLFPIASHFSKDKEYSDSNSHVEQTLAARDRLIEATEKFQAEIQAAESDIQIRSLERDLARNLQKIRTLETPLDRYDIDYQPYKHVENTGGLLERLTDLIDRIANRDDPTAE